MTQINWENTRNIFSDRNSLTSAELKLYDDDEVIESADLADLSSIFLKVNAFTHTEVKKVDTQMNTYDGVVDAVMKRWTNGEEKVEFWKTVSDDEMGWGVVYCSKDALLVVGNYFDHPFVISQSFQFENSDGSTFDDYNCDTITLEDIKKILTEKSLEYLTDQIH